MQQTAAHATDTWQLAKDLAQIVSYVAAALVAFLAYFTYFENSRRERSELAFQLYKDFYEGQQYKEMREKLDCEANFPEVLHIVAQEPTAFTDYLNFFEMVCFLVRERRLGKRDVLVLFHYYLSCLQKHEGVADYISTHGFEQIDRFLKEQVPKAQSLR